MLQNQACCIRMGIKRNAVFGVYSINIVFVVNDVGLIAKQLIAFIQASMLVYNSLTSFRNKNHPLKLFTIHIKRFNTLL